MQTSQLAIVFVVFIIALAALVVAFSKAFDNTAIGIGPAVLGAVAVAGATWFATKRT